MPDELLRWPQWVLWRYETKPDGELTKVPYTPYGTKASVTDRSTWSDYATAYNAFNNGGYSGLGFVLSNRDPFCCIDLDDAKGDAETNQNQLTIVEAFNTYSELSPSGKGLHLWLKGVVPSGRRRQKVEVYSSERFMTVTFNTYQNKQLEERQELLTSLWEQMSPPQNVLIPVAQSEQTEDDLTIYNQASTAKNGDLFLDLWNGNWKDRKYESQSEADFAIINIISFYSKNIPQIERMFLQSGLGRRIVTGEKHKAANYISRMALRSFDLQTPDINIDVIRELATELNITDELSTLKTIDKSADKWDLPSGLIGDIAKFIFESAPHPFQEIALGGAIGLLAGICGRSYNISGTGLNQYVVILAGTGTGKEAAASGINKLMAKITNPSEPTSIPGAIEFVGPADISSGPALIRQLVDTPCFISVMSEFGLTLQKVCAKHASHADITFRKALLETFGRSGAEQSHRPTIYSDKSKNTQIVKSPNFSILGESTPEEFYKIVDEGIVAQGFLPRFTIMEYKGPRVHYNEAHQFVTPSKELVQKLSDLCVHCLNMQRLSKHIKVALDIEASVIARDFQSFCTDSINATTIDVEKQLWTRAHLKMLKLAALLAVGSDIYTPVINRGMVEWAKKIITTDIHRLLERFESGSTGMQESESNQLAYVVRTIGEYLRRTPEELNKRYEVDPAVHKDCAIGVRYLSQRLLPSSVFKNDRMGPTFAITRALNNLVNEGSIIDMRSSEVTKRYGKTSKIFQVLDPKRFLKE